MTDTPLVTPEPPLAEDDSLAAYAQRAYLEYALSVVKGRALPDGCDGQKPVQRRLLYAMQRMGLGVGSGGAARPVKSARVVGDVLGRFHPHGDQAAYDALVRMAQDFSQRYPLIDGQGNFGSRDGDGAAAMRYTEARLSRITRLLLDEIDEGTVDFVPNYDGSTEEPAQLPARLPFVLLNGASGIAVGMATEIPSHNLREVAAAAVALLKKPKLSDDELAEHLPGPDFPGGGQIISAPQDIAQAYRTGRGSLKVRAQWSVEDLARGQWQLVVHTLPPGTSAQKVLEEIEEITNPKVRAGKKALTAEQNQLKTATLALLDGVRDESGKEAAVRLVFEPRSKNISVDEFITALLAHTSLETSVSVNLTAVGRDGRPAQKSLRALLEEWLDFRQATVQRRSQHRLEQITDRLHILEGRQLVLLNLDEVIAIIRQSDEPKAALIERFGLSTRQAEDILEIRLRQLARLEAIKIEQEIQDKRAEQASLQALLASDASQRKLMIKEIEADAKTYGDDRRTLIRQERRAVAEVKVLDEPVTVVVSRNGWLRVRAGHGHDAAGFTFKAGDALYAAFACRSVDQLVVLGSNGRAYSVAVAQLPGARGDGQPATSFIDLEPGTRVVHFMCAAPTARWLLATSAGHGLLATTANMHSRQRGGKAFLQVADDQTILPPALIDAVPAEGGPCSHIACVSGSGRVLTFALDEVKTMASGGRGVLLMGLDAGELLAGVAGYTRRVMVSGQGRGGRPREDALELRGLNAARAVRGRKGKKVDWGFKPSAVRRADEPLA